MICRNHPEIAEGIRRCSRCGTTFCQNCLVEIQGLPYCATCKSETIRDVRSGIESPARLRYASVWRRWGAIIIDGLITTFPLYVVVFAVSFATASRGEEPPFWMNFVGIPMMFVSMIYEGLMFQHKDGQTLGKMVLSIRVVRADGSLMSPGQGWGRAALKLVFGCLAIIDYLPAFFTDERTTLHDMAAKTRVVEI